MAISPIEAKKRIRAKGMTIKEWAKDHGFPVTCVRAVLNGHNKGHYGQSHKIAVQLGLKDEPR